MPIARFELPDGRIGRFEVPDGTTPEQAIQLISSNLGSLIPKEEKTTTQPAQQVGAPVALPTPQQVEAPAAPAVPQQVDLQGNYSEMKPYEPTFMEGLMNLIPSNKAKSANEFAARRIAQEQGIPVSQVYTNAGGARPIFNPEGRPPIKAGVEAAKVVAGEAPNIVPAMVSTGLQAIRAGDIEAPQDKGWLDKTISAMKPTRPDGQPDKNYESFQGIGESLGFSLASMVASATADAAATLATANPIVGTAAGMATSGALAYRAQKDDFLSRVRDKLNDQSVKIYGHQISQKEWDNARKEYNQAAVEYGAWEAIPEAVSNAVFLKAFVSPAKGASRLANIAEKVGSQVVEQATETATSLGQNAAELKAGLTDQEMGIADAFRQQFLQTLMIGGTMSGGAIGLEAANKFYKEKVEPKVAPNSALAKAIKADIDAFAFSPENIRREAVGRLDPNSYNQEVIQQEPVRKPAPPVAMAPPPPPEEARAPAAPEQVAGPSISQDTQAMLDELSGKNIEEAPVEPKAEEPKVEERKVEEPKAEELKALAPPKKEEPKFKEPAAPKVEEQKTPKLPPNVEQVASFPMGENSDYHVLKTPTGFVANLYDNDAGKYVSGSTRLFPTATFGDEAQAKAVAYAKEQSEKAAKFNEPTEVKKEEPVVPKVEEKLPPEELKAEEKKPTVAIEPNIKVGKSKLTPAPILEKLAQPAIDGINNSNNLVNQLSEAMATAKDPGAHQQAIDNLNNTAIILNDKGQAAVDEMARNNNKTPGEQNRAIQKAGAELKKALIEHNKSLKAAKKLITPTKARIKKIQAPLELKNKTEEQLDLERRNKDLEYAEMARRQVKTTGLFGALKGDLTAADVRDISLEDRFTKLKSKSGGQSLSDIVLSGRLDAYLPNDMRHDAPNFDDKESAEYIKERLRQYNYMTFDAEQELEKITSQIEDLRGNIKELEDQIKQQLELKDVNLLLEEAFNEQREADFADTVIEPEDENRAIEPGKTELALTGQTPDEVRAAERAKEDRLKTEREAEAKAKADEGVGEFTLTGSNRPADIAAAKGQEDLFGEAPEQRALSIIKQDMVRFASGMSGISDLETGTRARGSHQNHGIGVDVGLLSNNAIDSLAHAILNMNVPVFIDSGAFSNFRQNLKGNGPKPLDFNKILAKYDQITEAIHNLNEDERTDYPRPIIVMPDIVGDQAGSLALIDKHKDWIIPEIKGNITQPMIPIQNGALTLSQAYDHVVKTLGTDDFIVGVPSNAEAITKDQLTDFLRESKPKNIHFLGAASDSKLNPLLSIVANESPDTKVTADASKVRSAILDGVTKGKTREQAIMDALMEEEDPGVLLAKFGPQITDESDIIDGTDLVREVGNEEQLLLIADESNKLTANEKAALEEEYGAKHGSNEFLERLHNDVFNFITQGAKSIKNRIRPIINKIANSLLSVAMVLNPSFITKPEIIAVPQYETRTETIYADVPADAKAKMSPAAQQIYSVVYPTIKAELMENNKFFILTDKPTARNFIFNPDGSLLLDKKVLLSKSMGDFLPSGSNNIDANKITPAGLYNLGLRDASRSKGEAETAGEYDYGKVFVIEHAGEGRHGPYSMTIMHSVWTHESDAAQRLAALKTERPDVSRFSFGCINVDKETFGDLVKNHLSQMDGAKLFIVPDSATNAMDFVNGKATYRDDMMRQRVEPLTREVKTPIKEAKKPREEQIAAKEEEYQIPLNAAVRNFNMPIFPGAQTTMEIDRKNAVQEYAKVNQRRAYVLKEVAKQGSSLSLQQELTNLNALAKNLKDYIEDTKDQARTAGDFDTYARQLLNNYEKAKRNGLPEEGIAKEVYDVIHAAYEKAPFLLEGLKLSVIQSKDIFNSTLGEFDLAEQIVKLYKKTAGAIKAEIVRHELAHAMEQMMSPAAKVALIEAWERDFKATVKKSQNPQAKNYIQAVEMFFANPSNATYDAAVAAIPTVPKTGNKEKDREEFNNWYQFLTPSEYWAVNAEKLMHKKLGSGWDRFVLAMRRLFEGLKKVLGVNHKSEVYKVFNDIFSRKPSERIGQSIANVAAGIGVSLKSQGQMFPPAPQPQQVAPLSPQGRQGNMFPPGPPSKRNVFGGPAPQKTWDLAPETKLGHLINTLDYKIHDKHVDTRQVQAAITKNSGLIDDAFDAYMKEELYHGRTANEIKDFLKNDLSPVVKDLISAKLSIDDLEQYLHNRHAEERNDAIAQINPRFADVDNEPGSGIGTQAAKDYFKNLDPTKAAELAKIAAKVDDIIKGTQKILVDRGLETQATIDNWNQAYKHYIPLMRDQEELDFMHHGVGLGKGFQVKGSASKRAYGSTKSVVDILANIAIQRESAIIRSEKARIGRALYGMALKNPNPDFWLPVNPDAIKNKAALYQELVSMGLPISTAQNFIQEPKTPSIDPLTGQVRYTINAGLRGSQNVFPVRINGKDRYIFFNTKDPKAIRMAQAMSNLDAQTLGGLLGTSAQITRWIASVNTQFNPVFGVINFTRDSFGAAFNLTNTPLAGKQKEVAKHVFPAMFAIFQGERASRKNAAITGPYVALYDQFRRAGGTTGFRESFAKGNFSGKDTTIVERLWADETQSGAMKKARYVFDALSDYNEAMENAVRLSVFKVALDMGLSEERAASLGKNVTINFNRKGQASPLFQALYAFFNPAVQGAVLVGKTLNGPAGRKIIAGGLAVGVLQALWMAAAGFDADEPPDYVRDKNFIIPIGNKKYLTLPMPPGYNVVPGVARIATEYILGKNHLISGGKPITDAATQVLGLFLDSFNPLGSGTIAQMLSPTPIDPIIAVTMNKDAFGRPIFKEDTVLKPTPGFMRSRENSTQISQWIAEFLNYVSSPPGTHYTKGKISPTADEIDYYAGQIGGGAAREVIKAGELAKSAFTSEPMPSYRIPLAGRFYGDAKSQAAIQDKFYNNITLMNKYGNEIINTQKSGQDPSKYMAAHPEAQLYYAASNLNNAVNEMNKNKKMMLKNKVPLKDIRDFEAQKYQLMKSFNDQVADAQKRR